MSNPASHADALRLFVRERDVACPHCRYNLRDLDGDACPECGQIIALTLDSRSGMSWPYGIGLVVLLGTVIGLPFAYANQIAMWAMIDFFTWEVVITPLAIHTGTLLIYGVGLLVWLLVRRAFLRQSVGVQWLWAMIPLGVWLLQRLVMLGMSIYQYSQVP